MVAGDRKGGVGGGDADKGAEGGGDVRGDVDALQHAAVGLGAHPVGVRAVQAGPEDLPLPGE